MNEKTLDQVLSELPGRKLYLGGESGERPPTYRPVRLEDAAVRAEKFVLMEIDYDDASSPCAITWWPGGMVSEEISRGVPMPIKLMFLEVQMLMAINEIKRVLVTMDPAIEWDPDWPLRGNAN